MRPISAIEGGRYFPEDFDFDDNGVEDLVTVSQKTGWDAGAQLGYDFGAFRLEADVSYQQASLDQVVLDSSLAPADYGLTAFTTDIRRQEQGPLGHAQRHRRIRQ